MGWKRHCLFFAGCAADPGVRAKQGISKGQTCPSGVFYLYNEEKVKTQFDQTYTRADCEQYRAKGAYWYDPDDTKYAYKCDEFFGEPESQSTIKYFARGKGETEPKCECSAQESHPLTFTITVDIHKSYPNVNYKYYPDVNTQKALSSDFSNWVYADAYMCQTDAEKYGFHTLTPGQTCPTGNFYMYNEADVIKQFAHGYSRADCEAFGGPKPSGLAGAYISYTSAFKEPFAYRCDEFFGDEKLDDPKSAIKYFAKTKATFITSSTEEDKPNCECSDPSVSPSKSMIYEWSSLETMWKSIFGPSKHSWPNTSRYVDYKYFPDVNTQESVAPSSNDWVYASAFVCRLPTFGAVTQGNSGEVGVDYGQTCPTGTFYTYREDTYQYTWVRYAGEYTFAQCQDHLQNKPEYNVKDTDYSYACNEFFPSNAKGVYQESHQKYFGVANSGVWDSLAPQCTCSYGSPKSATIPGGTINYKYFPDVNTQAAIGDKVSYSDWFYAYAYECQ